MKTIGVLVLALAGAVLPPSSWDIDQTSQQFGNGVRTWMKNVLGESMSFQHSSVIVDNYMCEGPECRSIVSSIANTSILLNMLTSVMECSEDMENTVTNETISLSHNWISSIDSNSFGGAGGGFQVICDEDFIVGGGGGGGFTAEEAGGGCGVQVYTADSYGGGCGLNDHHLDDTADEPTFCLAMIKAREAIRLCDTDKLFVVGGGGGSVYSDSISFDYGYNFTLGHPTVESAHDFTYTNWIPQKLIE